MKTTRIFCDLIVVKAYFKTTKSSFSLFDGLSAYSMTQTIKSIPIPFCAILELKRADH